MVKKKDIDIERLHEQYETEWTEEEKSLMSAAVQRVMHDYHVSDSFARATIDKLVDTYWITRPAALYMNWQYANDKVRGSHFTQEHKDKIGAGNRGKVMSEESRKKLSESRKGKYKGRKSPRYGQHCSEETKEKMRQSLKKTLEKKRALKEAQKENNNVE